MDSLAALLCILLLSLFLVVRFRINPAAAPLTVICGVTLFLVYTGMAGLLGYAVYVVYAAALLVPIYLFAIRKEKLSDAMRAFCKPGLIFFAAATLFFFVMFSIRTPFFRDWDEFSFWGTAVKVTHQARALYTLADSSILSTSYQPFFPVFSFFVQGLSSHFVEWKVFLAYDMIMMACFSLLFSRLQWKNIVAVVSAAAFSLCSLYLFFESFEGYTFCTAYIDLPLGVLFGGVLLMHFHSDTAGFAKYLCLAVTLATLPLAKDMGLALGMLAAGVIFVDMLLAGNTPTQRVLYLQNRWVALVYPLALFLVVGGVYLSWNFHFAAVSDITRAIRPYEYSALEIFTGKDPFFNELFREMTDMLSTFKLALFGTIAQMLAIFTLGPIVISLLFRDRKRTLRVIVFSLVMCAGFFAYYYFHTYCYTATMPHATRLMSVERYISSYPVGWMVALTGVLFGELRFERTKYLGGIFTVVALLAALVYHFPATTPLEDVVFAHKNSDIGLSELRLFFLQRANAFSGLTTDDRIYFVCQNSAGGEAFFFNYQMMPAYTVPMIEGGDFVADGDLDKSIYAVEVDREEFADYLIEQEVDLVFVMTLNEYFIEEFSSLFEDKLMARIDNTVFMYYVIPTDGSVTLTPVGTFEHYQQLKALYEQ